MIYVLLIVALLVILVGLLIYKQKKVPKFIPDPNKEITESLDEYLSMLQSKGKFNGAVLIAKDGMPQFINTYGYTDHTKETPLNLQSSFRLGSVSKQFTAAAIMILKEQGLLTYDDKVTDHIEEFSFKKVTIRHLLNQTSGFTQDYMRLSKKIKRDKNHILGIKEATEVINIYYKKHTREPNEAYQYNNANYVLLARVIEVVSEVSFEEFMTKTVFKPLGMQNTRVWTLLSKEYKGSSNVTKDFLNYFNWLPTEIKSPWIDGVAGDRGIFSSIEDFLVWDQFWYANPLLSQETIKEAFEPPMLKNGKKSDYGFGWVVNKDIVWHNGKWLGANTIYIRNPTKKTCVVVLDNSTNPCFYRVVAQIRKSIESAKPSKQIMIQTKYLWVIGLLGFIGVLPYFGFPEYLAYFRIFYIFFFVERILKFFKIKNDG
ncbi:serine hydrolase domain-containing protein [Aquimarina sp. 2201CG1-2-11]|uniref:serine hydrolase domain-containing protein n=1 Tax=Aquimarina discodermiae TaxID=3231043 RepID=UPI0034635035